MPKLKEKSEMNLSAAEMLIKNDLYAPSVHCAYYGCFQLMKHAINNYFEKPYNELEAEIHRSKQGTHVIVAKYITDEIKANAGKIPYTKFNRTLKELKTFRNDSDYFNVEVDYNTSNKSLQYANELITKIKEYFNV